MRLKKPHAFIIQMLLILTSTSPKIGFGDHFKSQYTETSFPASIPLDEQRHHVGFIKNSSRAKPNYRSQQPQRRTTQHTLGSQTLWLGSWRAASLCICCCERLWKEVAGQQGCWNCWTRQHMALVHLGSTLDNWFAATGASGGMDLNVYRAILFVCNLIIWQSHLHHK